MNQEKFTGAIGLVFEESPWIAEQAWGNRPFSSVAGLQELMVNIVKDSNPTKKINLIKAHPDLGASVKMTPDSVQEQKGVGLDRLTEAEREELLRFNRMYIEKFSFPFIMAVRGQNKNKITEGIKQRIENDYDTEFNTALQEIYKIASFRLHDLIQ